MNAKDTKQEENFGSSSEFGFIKMGQMMTHVKKFCCSGKDEFPDCSAMMKDVMKQMKDQNWNVQQEVRKESKEEKNENDR